MSQRQINPTVGWTVDRFVMEEKEGKKKEKAVARAKRSSAKVMTKTTPTKGKKTVIKMKGKK